jgi:2-polyprenyl-3-methyl-5-hydroxy-6-metoxy-1,4-benzoquinol methylase
MRAGRDPNDPPGSTELRRLPTWDELYRSRPIEQLLLYWPGLDPDLAQALARHGLSHGDVLDVGSGPGSQALALAERGFHVVATDVSPAVLAYAEAKAKERGVAVTFIQDNVLGSRLTEPFDIVLDRGCFHGLLPEHRPRYTETIARLSKPGSWLFLKTFSHLDPAEDGPHRFRPEEIERLFYGSFEVVEILDTVFHGRYDTPPKALFCALRRATR